MNIVLEKVWHSLELPLTNLNWLMYIFLCRYKIRHNHNNEKATSTFLTTDAIFPSLQELIRLIDLVIHSIEIRQELNLNHSLARM